MAAEPGSRGILVPLLLLFLAHSLGAPIWLIVLIAVWYSGLVYAESTGALDRFDATRAMGVILMIRTKRGMRLLDFFSKPCLLYTSPSPRDSQKATMPSSA